MVEKGNKTIWSTRKGNLSLDYTLVKKRKTVSIARLPLDNVRGDQIARKFSMFILRNLLQSDWSKPTGIYDI